MRVRFGEYELDTETRTLQRAGRRIPMQSKAFDLLAYLIDRRERVVASDELLDVLWPGLHVTPAALSTAVQKARQAVGDDGEHQTVIHTEHGKGFRFVAEVTELSGGDEDLPQAPSRARIRWAAAAGFVVVLLAAAGIWQLRHFAAEPAPSHSLAVLPFVNMSADPDQEYFADGIAEELLNTVAHFDGLRVVGRTSSFSFKGSAADLTAIGKALGADVVLEGSVRTADGRVRITAQLVDAADGFHRWSETYDRELTDIFAIQKEIATSIAEALRVELDPEQQQRLAVPPTQSLPAYQAYLLGRQRLAMFATATTEEAIGYFQRAIELDPKLALAHAGLTESYLVLSQDGGLQAEGGGLPEEMIARAQASAERALALDDRLAEAHVALGLVKVFKNDIPGAEADYRRALALNPNSVSAYVMYANLLGVDLARYEEALPIARRAVELDPLALDAVINLGDTLQSLGRFDEALAWYRRTLEIDPDFAWGHTKIGMHDRYVLGRIDETTVWLAKALALDPKSQFNLVVVGWQFLDLGDPDRAEYWFERAAQLGPDTFYVHVAMQTLAVYRGDEAAVSEHGRKALVLWPYYLPSVLMLLRDREVRAGRYEAARALYEEYFPELLQDRTPEVDDRNYKAAIDLALILSRMGEPERADWLLDRSLDRIRSRPRLGWRGYWIADVQIHAQRGDTRRALASLREAVDQGWRAEWWWSLARPDLDVLRGEPEFQAIVEEIRADMAAQLAHVREMERNGELELIPELTEE